MAATGALRGSGARLAAAAGAGGGRVPRSPHLDPGRVDPLNFARMGVTPAEQVEIGRHSERILRDPRAAFPGTEIRRYLLRENVAETTVWQRLVGNVARCIQGRRYGYTLVSHIADRASDSALKQRFLFAGDNFAANVNFFILHAWLFEGKLRDLGAAATFRILDDAVMDVLRNSVCDGISHTGRSYSVGKTVKHVEQTKALVLAELSGAMDDRRDFAGLLRRVLWTRLYDADVRHYNGWHLDEVTVYTLRLISFLKFLPREAFLYADWMWPEWPPGEGVLRAPSRRAQCSI